ncbi:MAG: dienelactone hydrolase family protein [Phycisphaerales bacterium]
MPNEFISYRDGEVECEACVARGAARNTPVPVVLVCHAWAGQDDFARARAQELAELGYIGCAIDVYGKGRRGKSPEENSALMTPFVKDRAMLKRRLLAALSMAQGLPGADPSRLGAIGFCFGGLCALDMARAGAKGLRAVVSFHGIFAPPGLGAQGKIGASVLCLHGYDDPMCTPDAVVALAKEMTDAGADWEIDMYGNTVHAFTNPDANDPKFGTVFKRKASDRAFARMRHFLAETLA